MDALSLMTKSLKLLRNSYWLKSGTVGITFSPLLRRDFSTSDSGVLEKLVIITCNTVITGTSTTVVHISLVILMFGKSLSLLSCVF